MSSDLIARMRILAAEYASRSDAELGVYLDGAARITGRVWFGASYSDALCHAAAHELALASRRASAASAGTEAAVGTVASASAGPQSISYDASGGLAAASALGAYMRQTAHGLRWLALRDASARRLPRAV